MKIKNRQVLGIALLASAWVRRQPLWMAQGLIGALAFIITLLAWGGEQALVNLAIAYTVIIPWAQGVNIVAQFMGLARNQHELERFVASPVSLPVYFVGLVIGTLPYLIVGLAPALVLVLVIKMSFENFARLLILAPIGLALGSFFSLAIVLHMKNASSISAITNPLATLTVALPPVYYPLSILPPALRVASMSVPTVPLMELARWLVGFNTTFDPLFPAALIAAWLSATIILIFRKLKWGLE